MYPTRHFLMQQMINHRVKTYGISIEITVGNVVLHPGLWIDLQFSWLYIDDLVRRTTRRTKKNKKVDAHQLDLSTWGHIFEHLRLLRNLQID